MSPAPQRIVCLSAEAADWFWRLGAWDHVVGVTAFFELPEGIPIKPSVGGFSNSSLEKIAALKPDLIVTFSDVQAKMTAALMRHGLPVLGTNQRTLAEVEATLALLGRIVDRPDQTERLLTEFREKLAPVKPLEIRPRVYFEEWNDPLISGIAWVTELIERAGGIDIFPELRAKKAASERTVSPKEVCLRNPDIIFASWCGRPVEPNEICSRADWDKIAAVRNQCIFPIQSEDILQPGFGLLRGYKQMKRHLKQWQQARCDS